MTITRRILGKRTVEKGRMRRAFSSIARTALLATGLTLAGLSVTSGPSAPSASLIKEAKAATPSRVRNYSTSTNPFALDRKLKGIVRGVPSGNNRAKVSWIFKRLNRYASGGVKVLNMTGKPPRTATQALKNGGDCTDLANIYISIAKKKSIPGGVMLVHFNNAPKSIDHLVPYAIIKGRKVIVDLQTNRLGKTAQGRYKKLMDMTYYQAAGMYHREMGDYFRDKRDRTKAMKAYKRSLQLNDKDPYVHQNVAILYEKKRDLVNAAKHMKKAAALDPAYKKHAARATYNAEIYLGRKAYGERRFAACAKHFTAALNSGHKMPARIRSGLKQNIGACKANARSTGR